jgi:hypothetical protein
VSEDTFAEPLFREMHVMADIVAKELAKLVLDGHPAGDVEATAERVFEYILEELLPYYLVRHV